MTFITKSIKYLFLFIILITCSLLGIFWIVKNYDNGKIYNKFFEKNSPEIIVSDEMLGIGIKPTNFKIDLEDSEAGLDAVTVKLNQKNRYITLKNQKLNGEKKATIQINLDFNELKLTEGIATLVVKAFDKSFWSNTSEKTITLDVDARNPSLKIITGQHNLLLNGVQLVIYKATDDKLFKHGIEVGDRFFQGFPASLLDKQIEDSSIYGAFYSVYSSDAKDIKPIAVAEDKARNRVEKTFYNKKIRRRINDYPLSISPYFIKVMEKRFDKKNDSQNIFLKNILETMAIDDSQKIFKALDGVVFKLPLKTTFVMQKGTVLKNFGSQVDYVYQGDVVARKKEEGMTLSLLDEEETINAISDGVVIFVKKMPTYGNVVAVSHGGSVVAIYAKAGDPLVKAGDAVTTLQPLLKKANSGTSVLNSEYLLEIRIDGYPVNPQEFFDNFWCEEHIADKVRVVKEDLGIIIPRFNF